MAKTLFWGIPMRYALYVGSGLVGMLVGGGFALVFFPVSGISPQVQLLFSAFGYLVGSYAGWFVYEKFR